MRHPALFATISIMVLAGCGADPSEKPVTVKAADGGGGDSSEPPASIKTEVAAPDSGYPALPVTRNTSRISGDDPVQDAAEVALATHPRFAGAKPIEAAIVVPAGDWQAGLAASSMAGDPLRLPILLSESGSVPGATADALEILDPQGGSGPADAATYTVGGAAVPEGVASTEVAGDSPAAVAAELDKLHTSLTGTEPAHLLIVSDEHPAFAMPAAAWSARSGDPILFVSKDEVPKETKEALATHPASDVYLLGPVSSASETVFRELARQAPGIIRITGDDPVSNSIAFAQYVDGTFGWAITDPGHGLVIANSDRPADAGAASALSASGTYGPLLVTDSADRLPQPLEEFLTSIKPGYNDDPTRALYNRIWLIGGGDAISGPVQGQIDELAELARIGAAPSAPAGAGASGSSGAAASPGSALPGGGKEQEPVPTPGGKKVAP